MVNLLLFNLPVRASLETMGKYQKVFMGELLRKGGHPVLYGRAASGSIDNVDDSEAGLWHSAALVRYRSRRDLMEMIPATLGSEHHGMKLAALDKTLSIPASPWFMWGGPKVLMPLLLILLSVLGTCVVTGQAADQALARHGPARRIASTVHHYALARKSGLAHYSRLKKFLRQNFPGMERVLSLIPADKAILLALSAAAHSPRVKSRGLAQLQAAASTASVFAGTG